MKKIIFLYLLSALLIQCHKANSPKFPITDVTGIAWQLFSLQKTNDPFINPIPTSWYLQLNDDRSFTFTLHDVTGTGTYSWMQADSINAKVTFTIQHWNFPVADTQYTNRLKDILPNIDSCHYLEPPYLLPIPFYINPAKMELQFDGNAGHFYVFKF
ncbi:MAG: hypothetical protein Q8941_18350 [Bacteroidota bacterium]|nr:hypothetical protein [Bacteroidota bacterium]